MLQSKNYTIHKDGQKLNGEFWPNSNQTRHNIWKAMEELEFLLQQKSMLRRVQEQKKQQGKLPAFPVRVIDSTGAGDAFHGAFAAALARGKNWLEILTYASVAGALCCTKTGARPGLPSDQQHRAFCQKQLS